MELIRTFIAIPLPEKIRTEFSRLNRELSGKFRKVKWVRPESIHLTLKFLGNLDQAERETLFQSMNQLFENPPKKFSLSIDVPGVFPNEEKPRILWLGINGGGMDELLTLQNEIEDSLQSAGFEREKRKYSPHFTVGRIKYPHNTVPLMKTFLNYPFPGLEFLVEKVHIMRSDLQSTGAVYIVQKQYDLRD